MTLLMKVAQAQIQTPFPIIAETFIVQILYEVLREAGLRVPRSLSQTISIVGALVIGETAINAGFISGPTLLVVAISAVCSYTIPSLYEPLALLRLLFILLGGTVGCGGCCGFRRGAGGFVRGKPVWGTVGSAPFPVFPSGPAGFPVAHELEENGRQAVFGTAYARFACKGA